MHLRSALKLTFASFLGLTAALAAAPAPESSSAPLPRPLTLEAALAQAAAHNPALLRTRESIREQEGVLVEARASQRPSLAAAASLSRTDDGLLESAYYEDHNWTFSVSARQVLYSGGGTQARVRGQNEQLEAARLAFSAALGDTLLGVRRQFYAVLLAREIVGVQEEAIRVLESELVNARHRRDAGTGSDFDVLRAEVAVANAQPGLIRARNAYSTAQNQLGAQLGAAEAVSDQATDLDVQGTLEVPHRVAGLADALRAARAHRSELQQQERLVRAAELGIDAARSGYRPTVTASAGYEWTHPSLITTSESRLDGWTAGVQANWNIFDGRATAGRVAQARARVGQAQFAAEERRLAIDVEVRQAHAALGEADQLLAAAGKVVDQARESLRLAQARQQAGTATQLDVLTAQSALTQARSNLAQARHDYAVACARLDRAVGTPSAADQP